MDEIKAALAERDSAISDKLEKAMKENTELRSVADNSAASAFVRYWTKAEKGEFWHATVCPLMTQSGHPAVCIILPPRSDDEL